MDFGKFLDKLSLREKKNIYFIFNIFSTFLSYLFTLSKKIVFLRKIIYNISANQRFEKLLINFRDKNIEYFIIQRKLDKITYFLYTYGNFYFKRFNSFLKKKNIKFQNFFHIGGNTGYLSIPLIKSNGFDKSFIFEPSHEVFLYLKSNIVLNNLKNTECINKGIYSTNGKKKIQINDKDSTDTHILQTEESDFETCDVITLDSFVGDKKFEKNLIIIDVQGAELEVLKGMKNFLKSKHSIIIEICPAHLGRFYNSYEIFKNDLFSFFKNYRQITIIDTGQIIDVNREFHIFEKIYDDYYKAEKFYDIYLSNIFE